MKKLIILDRDGIINKLLPRSNDEWDSPMTIQEIEIFPWVPKILKELNDMDYGLAIATNQPSGARGKTSIENLLKVHYYIVGQIEAEGAKILSSNICLHKADDLCECRKPKTGLLKNAFEKNPEYSLDDSWMVGDRATDIIAGDSFKLKTAWLGNDRDYNKNDQDLLDKNNIIPSYKGNDLRDFYNNLNEEVTFEFTDEHGDISDLRMKKRDLEALDSIFEEEEKRKKLRSEEDRDNWRYVRD